MTDPGILWAPYIEELPYQEPQKKTDNAAAYDFYLPGRLLLRVGKITRVALNLTCYMPENYMAHFMGRSGISSEYALVVLGGLIDSDYPGELAFNFILVPDLELLNVDMGAMDIENERFQHDQTTRCGFYVFEKGERFGQIVFTEKPSLTSKSTTAERVQNLHKLRAEKAEKARHGGHGSTGK